MNIAVIPAKGRSNRLPRKNAREFFGKPMFQHSVDTAWESGLFNYIVVSTDDSYISAVAIKQGCVVVNRPPELCERNGHADCGTQEVTRHAIELMRKGDIRPEFVCCIYATAPLMLADDLLGGFNLVSSGRWTPFVYTVGPDGKDAGQWYWGHTEAFMNRDKLTHPGARTYTLPRERVCDINTFSDYERATELYRNLRRGQCEQPSNSGQANSAMSTPSETNQR